MTFRATLYTFFGLLFVLPGRLFAQEPLPSLADEKTSTNKTSADKTNTASVPAATGTTTTLTAKPQPQEKMDSSPYSSTNGAASRRPTLFRSTTIDINLDFRSRFSQEGTSGSLLHTSAFRVKSDLGKGFNAQFLGLDQYAGFGVQQAVIDKEWKGQRAQAGIVRIPFGIYDYQETYASGLIDYAIPRVDYIFNSVDWGAPGAMYVGGSPNLQIEAAAFEGRGMGIWTNPCNIGGAAARLQTYMGGIILGASHWNGYFDHTTLGPNTRETVRMNGFDFRYAFKGLRLRGEYLFGRFDNDYTHGFYVDGFYQLPFFQKMTLVGRWEAMRPGGTDPYGKQVTLGFRYTLSSDWVFALNWRKNNGAQSYAPRWSLTSGGGGDVFFQVYRSIHL